MVTKKTLLNTVMVIAGVLALGTIAIVILTNRTSGSTTIPEGGTNMTRETMADVMDDPAYQQRIEDMRALGMHEHNIRAAGRFTDMETIAANWQRRQEGRRNDLSYILDGTGFPVAPNDIDMTTIKRFVFSFSTLLSGHNLVIDKTHGGIHFSDYFASMHRSLLSMPFSATFTQQDLDRLVQAIEESDLRHWQENIEGERGAFEDGFTSWSIGIEFSDGSLMRRSGRGTWDYSPPEHQWGIFTNFINTMGEEIIERHNAENPQADE